MSRKLFALLFLCVGFFSTHAQDSIISRVILIGDAGKIDAQQEAVLSGAAGNILSGKTTVLFLGDNIYPSGMSLPGKPDSAQTRNIIRSQFLPMRAKGAPVYFIPGNHDWDEMGANGLQKIQEQSKYLEQQHDPLLKLLPANGCPDPVEINISDSLVIIAFDSEWWLFQHNKYDPGQQCDCDSSSDVIDKMGALLYKNRYKVILLASHHPFQSYGHHGGYYSFKDHVFPLTGISPNLYLPLPVVGSLYPLLRNVFINPEDMSHPLYKSMIRQVDGVFDGFPNLVHVAGHEHGLQFIKSKEVQVVSGAGAKNAFVKKGKYSLFAERAGGYVTADLMKGNTLRLTYYVVSKEGVNPGFTYDLPYTDLKKRDDSVHFATNLADSLLVQAHPGFDSVSRLHRKLFGENYRKEWAAPTLLPLIKISVIKGGLTPLQRGGGHQSHSLRLKDKSGKEWVLRSVNKYPEVLLPPALRETFAKDIITDAMSAQHPYSALVVPVIAEAAGVPHANPIIGMVAPDTAFGIFEKDFANTLCLLEEREPAGNSDNATKMYKALTKDNDNRYDSITFLRARLLDLFTGDWDRHEDQWRWVDRKIPGGKRYTAVPRDRDQVFHVMEGFFPKIVSRPWIAPMLHNFNGKIKQVNGFFIESNALNKRFLSQFSYEEWMRITNEFVAAMTDSVLEKALQQLPAAAYTIGHDELLKKWQERRTRIPAAMSSYYLFLNKIVDIQTSDKNEFVDVADAPRNGLQVSIYKISKEGNVKEEIYQRIFYPDVTKEIRFYINNGNDSIILNVHSPIKLRIIGGKGNKVYNVVHVQKKVQVYGRKNNNEFYGVQEKIRRHLSDDSLNTVYQPASSYNKITPLLNAGFNLDDGILLGGSVKFTNQGFRKKPFANQQSFSFVHSFSSTAFKFRFRSEWLHTFGNADLTVEASALAPDNTQNFFGLGNDTRFDKTGNYKQYYRVRFSVYQVDPAIRWRMGKNSFISIGPSLQQYIYDADENVGRFINNTSLIHSSDSATIEKSKTFLGAIIQLRKDGRNHPLLPSRGGFFNLRLSGYKGLNAASNSFFQAIGEFAVYKTVDKQSAIIIANRIGGGITAGKPTFYQAAFLGGQENLLGYRQYRFAGEQMLYNNFEARIKLAEIGSYIIPGQLGFVGFYDAGKVWAKGYDSRVIHQGVGGGLYFAPAQLAVLQIVAGYSREGWYPYITLGLRF